VDKELTLRVYPTIAGRCEKLKVEGLQDGYYTAIFCNFYGELDKTKVIGKIMVGLLISSLAAFPPVYTGLHLKTVTHRPSKALK